MLLDNASGDTNLLKCAVQFLAMIRQINTSRIKSAFRSVRFLLPTSIHLKYLLTYMYCSAYDRPFAGLFAFKNAGF